MKFQKALLWINSVLFLLFGVGYLVAPHFFSSLITGSSLLTSSAAIDLRATYGGFGLGAGIFFALCALQEKMLHFGSLASFLVLFFIAVGRIWGIVVDGQPNPQMYAMLASEAGGAALFAIALKV